MRPHGTRFLTLTAVAASAAMALASCSSNSSTTNGSGSNSKSPILIGTSLSLTGDFSVDGQAFERGYNLWVQNINKSGGLLGAGHADQDFAALLTVAAAAAGLTLVSENADISDGLDTADTNNVNAVR